MDAGSEWVLTFPRVLRWLFDKDIWKLETNHFRSRLNSLPLSLRITLHQKNKTRSSNTCKILWKINFLSPSKSVTKCCYCMTHIVSSPTLGQGHWKFPLTFCGLLTVTVWKGKKIKLWGFYTFSNHFWPVFFLLDMYCRWFRLYLTNQVTQKCKNLDEKMYQSQIYNKISVKKMFILLFLAKPMLNKAKVFNNQRRNKASD